MKVLTGSCKGVIGDITMSRVYSQWTGPLQKELGTCVIKGLYYSDNSDITVLGYLDRVLPHRDLRKRLLVIWAST